MKLETLSNIISKDKELNQIVNDAYNLKIDLIDFVDGYHFIIKPLFIEIYGEVGYDWFNWFCCEFDYGDCKEPKAWDEDGNPICYSVESLWEYLESNCKNK